MKFGKHYADAAEFAGRYINFKKGIEIIRAHNSKKDATYSMGLNQFSDWSQQEIDNFLTL
jgi:hypothetical protein